MQINRIPNFPAQLSTMDAFLASPLFHSLSFLLGLARSFSIFFCHFALVKNAAHRLARNPVSGVRLKSRRPTNRGSNDDHQCAVRWSTETFYSLKKKPHHETDKNKK